MSRKYQLAQANFGRMLAPIDDPVMQGFVDLIDEINAEADNRPGFVWRLQTPFPSSGITTALSPCTP